MKTIGLIGCGLMGAGMAGSLLREHYTVYAYDPYSIYKEHLEEAGATFVESVSELAREADAVLLSLPNAQVLKDVLLGESGLLKQLQPGSFVFDMGTTDIQTTRLLHQEAAEHNIGYLDCPVSGGPAGAKNGTLTIMVGGNEDDLAKGKDVLEVIGGSINYIGPSGSGQIVKLCNNMLVAGITALLSETMQAAEKEGVEAETLFDIVRKSSGHNRVMEVFGENLLAQSFDQVLFSLGHMAKDIELYMDLSKEHKMPQPTSAAVNQLYRLALQQQKGTLDSTAIYSVLSTEGV
ncbi:NAD(P)-dependent oxidoreductase [Alkalicoccobacillus porphyridii]|uniref:NAD(P)-dependent oxidoreductase n=1 Tax=Alkalicoccobacillus porphyridii TaxID=2597270 RepID=A0A554A208_9BACI|nr:NAD(P)-dependent oxidoreductase [Alkalicoccobacillus porphyridii]TSB47705.1 NAD(P)-dependent oxidoreductase [Alkalicoccobacillus porphyridii]